MSFEELGMRIESAEFVGLRSPLSAPAVFSWGTADSRNVGLVKIRTSDGVEGWGETSVTFPLWSIEERAHTVNEGIAPQVTGTEIESIEDITDTCRKIEANMARLRLLWSPVAISSAIGALEMALLDALGKELEQPVWQMLGGIRQPIDLYAVGFSGSPTEGARQAQSALDEGYAAVKIRAGFGEPQDLEQLKIYRETLGQEAQIFVDVNMGWELPEALDMAQLLEQFDMAWLEEPLSRDDIEGLRDLRDVISTPLAAGENCYTKNELFFLIQSGLIDVVMPDLARCGGFLAGLEAAQAALKAGLSYSTHHYASDIGFSAMVAMCSIAGPSQPILRDISPWPLRESILSTPVTIVNGHAWADEGPGLTPAPDPLSIERHRIL